jgi:hypothetical protein
MLSSGNEALEYERTFAWFSGPFVLQGQVLPNFQVKIFNLKVRKHNYSALVFFPNLWVNYHLGTSEN